MKVAIFGSAFNPPHRGHMKIIRHLAGLFDKVIVLPAFKHAFGKNMASFEDRVRMTALAMNEFIPESEKGNIEISLVEKDIHECKNDGTPVFSIDVLDFMKSTNGQDEFVLAIGPDNADKAVFSRFKDSERILNEFGVMEVPEEFGVRSTKCREMIAEGDPGIEEFIGHDVLRYISQHSLFSKG